MEYCVASESTPASRFEGLVVLLWSSVRPKVFTFKETREWFLKTTEMSQALSRLPRSIFGLFDEIKDLFHS